eukprot:g6158.t1
MMQQISISPTSENWTTWHRITDLTKNIENLVELQNKILKNNNNYNNTFINGSNREKSLETFHQWLMKENDIREKDSVGNESKPTGCKWKIQDRGSKMGFGIVATENISKGETIIKIPASLAITTDTALEDQDLGPNLVRDEFLRTKPTLMLALHLLFERLKGKKSKYYLYIQSLPVAFDMLPYNWTLNDFHAMRGSPSFSLAIQTVCMLGFSYAYIYKKLAGNEFTFGTNKNLLTEDTFLFKDFRWAVSCVVSRQNPLPSNNGKDTALALIPIFEMLNHKPNSSLPSYLPEEKSAIIETACEYEKDDEVFMVYGRRPNRELLIYSGFVMTNNEFNNVIVRLKLSDGLARIRMLVLKRENILPTDKSGGYMFHVKQNGMPSKNLWYFAHVAAMDKNALTIAMRMSDEEDNEVREKCITGKDRIIDGTRIKALRIIVQYENQLIKNMMDLKTSGGKHLVKNGVSNSTKTLGLIENLIATEYNCLINSIEWCNTVGKVNEIVGYSQMEILNKELIEKIKLKKKSSV